MKTIAAFFRLIRWPNLVFIIITQVLFYYCIYFPQLKETPIVISDKLFFLLITASVLIAAAGYIINDYFDIQIDAINKPERMVVNKYIKRRWAIVWHLVFSVIGILLSFYVSFKIKVWPIFIINILCVVALYFYSTTFKKKLLIGNLIIAALTGWVILDVYLFAGAEILSLKGFVESNTHFNARRFFKFTLLYISFSFISTLIREVIKDLEDMEGDRKYNCNTMPIAWGVPASKVFVAVWIIVAIAGLLAIQMYAWLSGWWFAALYVLFLIAVPFAFLLYKLVKAIYSRDYNGLSTIVKFIMLAGILSMIIVKLFD
jgi:4-hydroxybenzoate polyprenyltransferase